MQRIVLKSKIHNAKITQTDLLYNGSITIDKEIMKRAHIVENELVQVVNVNNGTRFETYVICGEKEPGMICLNGPAARMGVVGDSVHILTYVILEDDELNNFKPSIIILNEKNEILCEK